MSGFEFETTPRIIRRDGAAAELGAFACECGMSHVMIVTDRAIVSSGLLQSALVDFAKHDIPALVFDRVQADPPEESIRDAVGAALEHEIDGVIGFGGGSSLDTAKLTALLASSGQELDAVYGSDAASGKRLPLIQVPTTAGTGSEVTPIAIVTTASNEKKGVVARQLYPDIAVLDAMLTVGLPARVTAMTGIDAMVHAIEAYTSRHRKNVLSDSLAVRALQLLSANLPIVLAEPTNVDARGAMLEGRMLAGMAFANAPVAAVHALAYPLGGQFHLPHGLSNALVLLPVLEFNLRDADALYAELCPHISALDDTVAAPTGRVFVERMRVIVGGLGLETSLRALGIGEEHLSGLAADAMKVQRLLVNNPREVSYEDALALYRQAL
jgi:alcohol dehydrogenase class IV